MKKSLRRIFLLAGMMLIAILIAQLALLAANFRTRRRAESLLSSLQKLKLGTSTFEDVQPLIVNYKAYTNPLGSACPSGDAAYGISISNNTIDALGWNSLLRDVGVRPVGADATLSFKNGRLCSFVYSPRALLSASRYPFREDSRSMTSQLIMIHNRTIVQAQPYNDENYNITRLDTIMRGREAGTFVGLLVTITPSATPSEYRHALTFDLSCFTSLQGCRTICQLMPLAFQDYVSKLRTHLEPVPEGFKEESESPTCLEAYNATR
jgi:hypothetical protein